jgi:hypothetical protein
MKLGDLTVRAAPTWLLAWLERRRAPLGERIAHVAWREGMRGWHSGRRVHDQLIQF